jgi:hypothetical protein
MEANNFVRSKKSLPRSEGVERIFKNAAMNAARVIFSFAFYWATTKVAG